MTGPVQVVTAMRSEFLDDLRTLPALAGRRIEAHVLAPLAREMLRDVIEQPAPTLPGLGQSGSFEHRQKGAR